MFTETLSGWFFTVVVALSAVMTKLFDKIFLVYNSLLFTIDVKRGFTYRHFLLICRAALRYLKKISFILLLTSIKRNISC